VGNVGPCLAICNGGGKDGFSPLDVTLAPCLDVTPSCHIKGWNCVRADANSSAWTGFRLRGRAHERRLLLDKKKTKFKK
jgi:hypothetical protein